MNDSKKRYSRTNVLSNPKVQLRIIFIFILVALLFTATNWYVGSDTLNALSYRIKRLPLSEVNRSDVEIILHQQGAILNLQLMILTFLALICLTVGGVILSHRIGGPIYRFNKYLSEIADGQGKPYPLHFRKHDFFHDLADSFNLFQRKLGLLPSEPGKGSAQQESEENTHSQPPC